MRKLILLAAVFCFFASCKKDNQAIEDAKGGVLDKLVSINGSDSTVTQFTYDSQGRLSGYVSTDYPGGLPGFTYAFTRDNNGRIIVATVTEVGSPSLETRVTYQPGSSMIKYTVSYRNQTVVDSTVYSYANGSVGSHNYRYDATTQAFSYEGMAAYFIQNGNLISHEYYMPSPNGPTLAWEENYTYDSKAPPLALSFEEALLTELGNLFAMNNVTQLAFTYPSSPNLNETGTRSYTYAISGQPHTAQEVWSPLGENYTLRFTYK